MEKLSKTSSMSKLRARVSHFGTVIRKQWNAKENFALDTWLWEVVSITFSVSCFVAIFGVLLAYDQKLYPEFPQGLSLNAIISILATGSKASLIFAVSESIGQLKWIWFNQKDEHQIRDLQSFDSASRGPLGAFAMVIRDRGRSLISLGALIMVLGLSFDPFMQQILSYPVRRVPDPYNSATARQSSLPFTMNGAGAYIEPESSIYAGLWLNNNGHEVSLVCPTGNCTWSAYRSTGWCPKCEDATAAATLAGCREVPFNTSQPQPEEVSCNVSLPLGHPGTTNVRFDPSDGLSRLLVPKHLIWAVSSWGMDDLADNNSFVGVYDAFMVLAYAELSLPSSGSNFTKLSHPENGLHIDRVTQCVISMCTRTYDVAVSDGLSTVNVSAPEFGKVSQFKNDTVLSKEFDMLEGYINEGMTLDIYENLFYMEGDWWYGGLEKLTARNDRIISTGLEKALNNIAVSLTNNLHNGQRGNVINGTVYDSRVFVAVDWRYIILPALIVILGGILLISTVFLSNKQKLNTWKSSVLPVLFHGLDQSLLNDGNEYATASSMEQTAKSVTVTLAVSDTGKRLLMQRRRS
ncbi:hypothetical protein BDW71DRAFT_173259 [Aspergillus fruticulosus]